MSILQKIVKDVKKRIEIEFSNYSFHGTIKRPRKSLVEAINAYKKNQVPVISEVKPMSPSMGTLLAVKNPAEIAQKMAQGGAVGISVLTEPKYFNGNFDNLAKIRRAVDIPVLMKDFVVDERQIQKGTELGADVILLITSICPIKDFLGIVNSYGLEALVEVHNELEVHIAIDAGAKLIGINNRDLNTLKVDLRKTAMLAPLIRDYDENATIISESGIKNHEDADYVISQGADAVLVGTSIMKSKDISKKVKEIAREEN